MDDLWIQKLKQRLRDRPGQNPAIARFAPSHTRSLRLQTPGPDSRQAAVMVLLYPRLGQWHLPLVLRSDRTTHHRGQIALPGGAIDANETAPRAALRELQEEIGVPPHSVELIGPLSPFFIPVSRYHVHPWIGYTRTEPEFRLNPFEVDALIETPLVSILSLSTFACEQRDISGVATEVPFFAIDSHKVWGATCIVLGELAMVGEDLRFEI